MAARGRPRAFDRDEALRRALEVFWTKGFEGASMTDLTGAMGIASPSLYAAFGSKEALFREATRLYEADFGALIWDEAERADTAFGAIEALLFGSARAFTEPARPKGCFVTLSALTGGDASAALCDDMSARRRGKIDWLVERIARGVVAGDVAPGTDARALARFYWAVQQGMAIQARDGADRAALEAVARSALAAWPALVASIG